MNLQNPSSVGTSTIQSTYGAILSSQNKSASSTPTSPISDYAVNPSASSPILSAFFQTLSQISNSQQNTSLPASANTLALNTPTDSSSVAPASTNTTNALQAFTYSLFQNLQGNSSASSLNSNSGGLGPLPNVTLGANTTYLQNLPARINSLSSSLGSTVNAQAPTTLAGLQSAYASLISSLNTDSSNTSVANQSSLAAFLNQMSQNLQSQNLTSMPSTGSLLDTKA